MYLSTSCARLRFGLVQAKSIVAPKMAHYHNIGDMRTKYNDSSEIFDESKWINDPFEQFKIWFEEVKSKGEIKEPNAMCLSTANKEGRPSSRYVLLKGYGPEGFTFVTNYNSKKGRELIRIEGTVEKIPEEESVKYFDSRPLDSRISAAVSRQSSVVPSREYLVKRVKDMEKRGDVKKPDYWGGYILIPDKFEFWQGQTDRLHDRLFYGKEMGVWLKCRLSP